MRFLLDFKDKDFEDEYRNEKRFEMPTLLYL